MISFIDNSTQKVLFTASVSKRNIAHLDGVTMPITQFARHVSTCPLDLTLWHRRFGHLNHKAVQKVVQKELVDGLVIQVTDKPDPICEPCLAGKQHRGPIPKSAYHSYQPLELIHSDVHGPMAVISREGGFKY